MGRFEVTSGITSTPRRSLLVGGGLLLVGVCLLLLSGCGRGTFVGRQYDDFTAYYNKFYNANRAFEQGVESFEETDRPVDRTRYLPVFWAPETQGSGDEFEEAIQKSADILRESPNSKWADDALLLIGKSYFYQGNYVGAAQKFREVLALPEGRRSEARFWLARTLVTNGRLDAAQEVVQVEAGAEDDSWVARQFLVLGQLRVQREQWAEAATALERGLAGDVPDEGGARGAFLLGQVHETLGNLGAARAAYRRVREFDPRYELGFVARLTAIELQGRHADAEEALERLDDLQGNDKNYEQRGAMALVEARIYRALGNEDRARQVLRAMLYDVDEPLPQADVARLHYDLAVLYRDAYEDFSRAAAHFDTSSTGLEREEPGAGVARQRLPSAPIDAGTQADRYRTLADRSNEVARLDSLLRIGRMSASEYEAFVAELRRKREEQLEEEQARRTGRRLRSRSQSPTERRQPQTAAAQSQDTDAGFLFYKDPTRVQQGRQRFVDVWGDRPRVDNWRRRNAMQNIQASGGEAPPAETPSDASQVETAQGSGPAAAGLDLSNIPRDPESQAEMEARRAVVRYELGNALFLGANRPDSAATWYRRVLQEDGDQPVARRALYALAEAQRAQEDTLAAQQAYQRLIERHPESVLARRARERLGRASNAMVEVRAGQADTLYARAYARWQEGAWRPALEELLSVAEQYPETEAAPRALLGASIIYWRRVTVEDEAPPRAPVERYLRATQPADSAAANLTRAPNADSAAVDSAAIAAPAGREGAGRPTEGATADVSPPADSARAIHGGGSPSDSSGARPGVPADTVRGPADTTAAAAEGTARPTRRDSATAAPDSTVGAGTSSPFAPLKALLAQLTAQYPEAPQAKRAQSIQALIKEKTAAPTSTPADERADAPPPTDSSTQETQARPADSTERPRRRSEQARPSEARSDQSPLPAPASATPSRPDTAAAGAVWTLRAQAFSSADAAARRVPEVQREAGDRWRVEAVQATTGAAREHWVVLGRFESRRAAAQAQRRLAERGMTALTIRPHPAGETSR